MWKDVERCGNFPLKPAAGSKFVVRIALDWYGLVRQAPVGGCLNGVVEEDIGRPAEGGGGLGGLEVLQCYNLHRTE